jgi:small subunit ribosomal protein S2
MRRFIFGERDGIYIIDLLQTEELLNRACQFAGDLARRGGTILFVGTKKQARDVIQEQADRCGMPYVNQRWLGGLLTNFQTISLRIRRLHDLERYQAEGQLQLLPTRERISALADLEKLQANLGGVKNMERVPNAVFVIDLKTEAIAVREAQRLRIPIIGLVDTNCDPDGIDYVIPGNDDAIRSCAAVTRGLGDVVADSYGAYLAEEERARLERERREAEEQARREAEEQARREAEEAAKAAAEAQAAAQAEAQASSEQAQAPAQAPAPEGGTQAPPRPRRQPRRETQPPAPEPTPPPPPPEQPAEQEPAAVEEQPAAEQPAAPEPEQAAAPEPEAPAKPEAPAAPAALEAEADPAAEAEQGTTEQPADQTTEEAS